MTPYLAETLGTLTDLPIVGDVRGDGFFWAMELVKDDDNTRFDQAERDKLLRGFLPGRLREAGIIARADDRGDAVLQIAPPLIADAALIDEIVARLHDVLSDAGVHMGLATSARATRMSTTAVAWSSATSSAASWSTAVDGATRDILNPATGEVIARVPEGTAADVERAVAAARAARIPWRDTTPAGARSSCSRWPTSSTATARSSPRWSRSTSASRTRWRPRSCRSAPTSCASSPARRGP